MVATPIGHNIKWVAPAPFWSEQGGWIRLPRQTQGLQPCILRFANDTFMEELLAMLNHAPWRLTEWVAQNEAWREPMPSPQPIVKIRPERIISGDYNKTRLLFQRYSKKEKAQHIRQVVKMPAPLPEKISEKQNPIKLYQAAHQRHYLVAASLVKEESGYPDYLPDISNNESATFVVRALVPQQPAIASPKIYDEYAYVITSAGMAWRKVNQHDPTDQSVQRLAPNEEQLPLFPVVYSDVCGRYRQIMGGLIPVVKRDEWYAAPVYDHKMDESGIANFVPANEGGIDHYKEVFYNDVIGPWKALVEQAVTVQENINVLGNPFPNFSFNEPRAELDKTRVMRNTRDEIQTGSWYVLLDLALFIRQHFPDIWKVLKKEEPQTILDDRDKEKEFFNLLQSTTLERELFLELAIENLVVGGFYSDDGKTLWNRLVNLWKLEIYLQLAQSLKESQDYANTLFGWVENYERWPGWHDYKRDFRIFYDQYRNSSDHSLLHFAKDLESHYPRIANNARNSAGYLNPIERYIVDFFKAFKVPQDLSSILTLLKVEAEGTIEVTNSLWDLLSVFWTIEDYFDTTVASEIAGRISDYIYNHENPGLVELNDQILSLFYQDQYGESWYTFLDFARDLKKIVPELQVEAFFEAFQGPQERDESGDLGKIIKRLDEEIITSSTKAALLYENIEGRKVRFILSLAEALVEVEKWEEDLDKVDSPYDRTIEPDNDTIGIDERWPDFLFPLADPSPGPDPLTEVLPVARTTVPPIINNDLKKLKGIELPLNQLDAFADLADAIIPKHAGQTAATSDINFQPFLDLADKDPPTVRFVARCVFERPNCGQLFPPVVSMATCQLEMARFFDPDAPARPVRITMPLDITPAGLRKYKKNAGFLISDMLCGKIKKIKKLTLADLVLSVLPWPFHKDLPNIGKTGPCRRKGETLGMFCSLSIPIVTLCALILLLIMVNLFNIFFKWIPYLFTCFPLPGLKGKKE